MCIELRGDYIRLMKLFSVTKVTSYSVHAKHIRQVAPCAVLGARFRHSCASQSARFILQTPPRTAAGSWVTESYIL